MTTHISAFAQEDIPNIQYFGITPEQAEFALRAAPQLEGYEVTLMPIDTPEEALATAQERAAHLLAVGDAAAKARGAFLVMSSREEPTPEEFALQLHRDRAARLFMRVRMPQGASSYELLREYYDSDLGPEENRGR